MRLSNKVICMVLFGALLLTMLVGTAFASEGEALDPDVYDNESLEAEPEPEEIPEPDVPLTGIPPFVETTEPQSNLNFTLLFIVIGGLATIILEAFAPTIISKIRKTTK